MVNSKMNILSNSDLIHSHGYCISESLNLEIALQAISKLQSELQILHNRNEVIKNTIAFKDGKDMHLVKVENILYLKAKSNYCYIYTRNKKPFFTSKTLKYWEETLPESIFLRCHKSHLINVKEVVRLNLSDNRIQMSDDSYLTVSRERMKVFKEKFRFDNSVIRHMSDFIK